MIKACKFFLFTEARQHIGMLSASYWEDPGSNPGKGENYAVHEKLPTEGLYHEEL